MSDDEDKSKKLARNIAALFKGYSPVEVVTSLELLLVSTLETVGKHQGVSRKEMLDLHTKHMSMLWEAIDVAASAKGQTERQKTFEVLKSESAESAITRDLMRKIGEDVGRAIHRMIDIAPEPHLPIAVAAGTSVISWLSVLLEANHSEHGPDPDCMLLGGLLLSKAGQGLPVAEAVRLAYRDCEVLKAARDAVAEPRADALRRLDAIGFDELTDHLAEGVHTAFRKGTDHPQARLVHHAISRMPATAWSDAINFVIDGLRFTTGREKQW